MDEDKKAWRRRKMTLKGSHKLIDALQYLRISGSFMAASTEVSVCVGGGGRGGESKSKSERICVQISPSLHWVAAGNRM